MGINGISGYRPWDIPREIPQHKPVEEIRNPDIKQDPSAQPQSQTEGKEDYAPLNDNRSRTANLEDVSLTFNKEESFDYIGSDSGLENLDMQKAISDMKKDEVLQGYQYFVGSAQNLVLQNSDDGAVFRKLGF